MSNESYRSYRDRQRSLEVPDDSLHRVSTKVMSEIEQTARPVHYRWKQALTLAAVTGIVVTTFAVFFYWTPRYRMENFDASVTLLEDHTAILLVPQETERK